MEIQIHNKNFDLTDPFKQYLKEKFQDVKKYQDTITNFKIHLSRDQRHNKGNVFIIKVEVHVPQKNIVIEERHADARAAVDIIQDKLARRLLKFKEKNTSKEKKSWKRRFRLWKKEEY